MKSLKKISAIALVSATVLGAPVFVGCQKQVIDINTELPDNAETIIIPGTDLTSIEALLAALVGKINADENAQLQLLINAIAGENQLLKTQLEEIIKTLKANQDATEEELQAIKDQLTSVIEAINALNDNLTAKIKAAADEIIAADGVNNQAVINALNSAIQALKAANETNVQNIINALTNNNTQVLDKIAEAVAKLDNVELNEKLNALIVLAAADNKDNAAIIAALQDLIDQMAELINATTGTTAVVTNAKNATDFVPLAEIDPTDPSQIVINDDVPFTTEAGATYASYAYFVPDKGAVVYTDEQIAELLENVENNLKIGVTKSGDVDEVQAKAAIKAQIAALPTTWTSQSQFVYELKLDKDNVTAIEAEVETETEINTVVIYCEINNVKYYVTGHFTVAGLTGEPQFKVTTAEGTTSHDGTYHSGQSDHSGQSTHGHEDNAGGGISGK